MPRLMLCVLMLLVSLRQPLFAGELVRAKPESVGMSSEKLALITSVMQKKVENGNIAGAITIVARHGKIVYWEAVGLADLNTKKPMNPDALVRMYSMSKPITSVAVLMLVEQGKLGLDEPLAKYLPAFEKVQVFQELKDGELLLEKPKRPISIRDLLRHTSGLTYGFFGNTPIDLQYRKADVLSLDSTLADAAIKLSEIPLLYQPGTRFNYSVSTDVLGRVVEVASGQAFDQFLKQHILTPLEMKDTGFFVPENKLNRFTANHGYELTGALRVTEAPQQSRYRKAPKLFSGGGGLVSSAEDYLRFCQMLLNEGELNGKRLLKKETVQAMTQNQLPKSAYPIDLNGPRRGVGFGLGFSVVVEKTNYTQLSHLGEYGWGGAASTHFWVSPKDDLAVVVLTQLMPFTYQMENAVKPLVYDAILDAKNE